MWIIGLVKRKPCGKRGRDHITCTGQGENDAPVKTILPKPDLWQDKNASQLQAASLPQASGHTLAAQLSLAILGPQIQSKGEHPLAASPSGANTRRPLC